MDYQNYAYNKNDKQNLPYNVDSKSDKEMKELCKPQHAIYTVFHVTMFFIAVFLSFRCNKGFDVGSFLVACVCPPIYIFYVLITEYDKDLCGLVNPMKK